LAKEGGEYLAMSLSDHGSIATATLTVLLEYFLQSKALCVKAGDAAITRAIARIPTQRRFFRVFFHACETD
jgi:hypothetical protein